jgi:hypothetical protein
MQKNKPDFSLVAPPLTVFAPNTQCHAENSARAGVAQLSEGDLLRAGEGGHAPLKLGLG